MKSYVLSYNGTGAISEIYADNDAQAICQALDLLGDDAVEADQWDSDGQNDEGEPCKRILFWGDEESAENDPGINSIAQLSTVGRA